MDNIIPKEKAWARIDQSFKMVKNNFLYLFFLPLFFQLIFNLWGFFPLLKAEISSNLSLSVLTLIWIVFLWLFNTVLMIRIVSQIVKWVWVNFWKDLQFTFSHILSYIKTFLYVLVFWYWIYILLFLISVIFPILNLKIWLLPIAQVALVSLIFMIVWAVWMILKTYSLFPVYFIALTEWLNSKESLKKSYEITKDKFWRTFWNFLFIILWLGVIKIAFVLLLWMFINSTVLNILFWALTSWVIISFTFLLFRRYEIENNWWESEILNNDNSEEQSSENENLETKTKDKKSSNWFKIIAVIVLILAVFIWWYFSIQNKLFWAKMRSYDAWTIADLWNTAAALQIYYDDNWDYPSSNWECLRSWKWVWKDIWWYLFWWKIPEWKNVTSKEDYYNWVCNKRWDIFYASLKKDGVKNWAFILCSWIYTSQKANTSWDIFTALWKIKNKKYETLLSKVWLNRWKWGYYCTLRP